MLHAPLLRWHRKAYGITAFDVGRALDVSSGAIRRIEAGAPVPETLVEPLARFLSVPLCDPKRSKTR